MLIGKPRRGGQYPTERGEILSGEDSLFFIIVNQCASWYNVCMEQMVTEKQREYLLKSPARINLLEGSVRSGKTWISLVQWALFVASQPQSAEFLMVGRTLTTLKRNCLGLLQELEPTFTFSTGQKRASLYGRTIWLEGAYNERSENSIRGMTLAGAYIDELTLVPEGFYLMCLSRLSVKGAKLFATTNPDSPMSYVYTQIIENNDIDKHVEKFLIEDNTFLDREYIDQLAREYTGVFYQRYFLGEWVIAEGLVYSMFDASKHVVEAQRRHYERFIVSMDYGTQNPTAMILFGLFRGTWYAVREYYHSGRDTNDQKTDQQYFEELVKLCDGVDVERVIIDPSASSFIALCRQSGLFTVVKAKNDVLDGIRHTAAVIEGEKILVNDCCKNLIREFGLYSWDSRAQSDAVVKENDHAMDALRYFVETMRIYRDENDYRSKFLRDV